jgi:hypothetical protein
MPIHPGAITHFFAAGYMPNVSPTFKMQIFAKDAEPTEWQTQFMQAEMQVGALKKCERRSLKFRTT